MQVFMEWRDLVTNMLKMKSPRPVPSKHPPHGYSPSLTLPIPGPIDAKLRLINRLLAVPSLVLYWAIVLKARPEYRNRSKRSVALDSLLGLVAGTYPLEAVHEGIHAVALWSFTGEPPVVSLPLRGGYASAASPKWYFPRGYYLVVGLAPVATLTPLLLALARVAPASTLPALGWAVTRNVSSSSADLYVARQLLGRPQSYLNDTGEVFTFWEPTDEKTLNDGTTSSS